jgi:acetoin utilization protein AcuB
MSRRIVVARVQDSVDHAAKLMERHGFRHLPVLRGNRLVGIISDRDLRGSRMNASVQDVMTLNPISISPDAAVDEAACTMEANKISALPVVEKDRVVGILTTTGILRAFVDLTGAAKSTTRIILSSKGGRAIERKLRDIVHRSHAELRWLHRQGGHLHVRLNTRDVDDVVTALEAAGFEVAAVVTSREPRTAAPKHTMRVPPLIASASPRRR